MSVRRIAGNQPHGTGNASMATNETQDRTVKVSTRLKEIYNKSILPVEKKYRYDYFFDSPLLSEIEFDGT